MEAHAFVDWCSFMREVCAWRLLQNPPVLGGPGLTVEIDESLFSRRIFNQGRVYPQQWVFGGYCRETKECFLYTVPNRTEATLLGIINDAIRPGTTIMSDQWAAYRNIDPATFQHHTVNHKYNFVDPATGAHTQGIESTWRNATTRNKKQFGTHRTMLDSYMCEFMWRKRIGQQNPFAAILEDIAAFWPPA